MTHWLSTTTAPDGTVFRDLNGNGIMDAYENPNLPVTERVHDLIRRMTIEEKVGQLFQPSIEAGNDGSVVERDALVMPESTTHTIQVQHITHFNVLQLPDAQLAATWHNRIQRIAEQTRLGIPVTISTDPRHSDVENIATSLRAGSFSAWPESLGLAALRDPELVREFAVIAQQEYRAVGIRAALHPQIDLATEPRWARQSTTFGPNSELTAAYVRAYLEGFQGTTAEDHHLTSSSVACMTKHFPGGGPQKDGEDPHFPYGREQVYPGNNFDYHLKPFRDAIEVGTSAIMPYYGMPIGLVHRGKAIEEVGFGYNKDVITGILRDELGFDGVVCTDWQLVSDVLIGGHSLPARAWGVEHLDRPARIAKILDAGCDQLGGETCTDVILSLVENGVVPESRLDESLARLLRVKFELGLFDNPYVNEDQAESRVGTADAVKRGFDTQVASLVPIEASDKAPAVLPLSAFTRVYVEGMSPESFHGAAVVVASPEEADIIVARLGAPFEPRSEFVLEPFFHAGTLEFADDTVNKIRTLATHAPVIVDLTLERPAVLTPLLETASVIIGSFAASDIALVAALKEPRRMRGRLPFALPTSMDVASKTKPDVPNDFSEVAFPEGHRRALHSQIPTDHRG